SDVDKDLEVAIRQRRTAPMDMDPGGRCTRWGYLDRDRVRHVRARRHHHVISRPAGLLDPELQAAARRAARAWRDVRAGGRQVDDAGLEHAGAVVTAGAARALGVELAAAASVGRDVADGLLG